MFPSSPAENASGDTIESLNYGFEISRENCFVDNNGYLRWKTSERLCHRDIAYNHVYHKSSFPKFI